MVYGFSFIVVGENTNNGMKSYLGPEPVNAGVVVPQGVYSVFHSSHMYPTAYLHLPHKGNHPGVAFVTIQV